MTLTRCVLEPCKNDMEADATATATADAVDLATATSIKNTASSSVSFLGSMLFTRCVTGAR